MKHNIRLEHLDYVQIHPTTLYSEKPGRRFLISESVRGEGAVLLNKNKERFVNELLPRDLLTKEVYKQMLKNSMVEICAMHKGTWIRVTGTVKEDVRREARVAMMEANKASLSSMYTVDDNLMTVFYFENGIATISSFTDEPKVIKF